MFPTSSRYSCKIERPVSTESVELRRDACFVGDAYAISYLLVRRTLPFFIHIADNSSLLGSP